MLTLRTGAEFLMFIFMFAMRGIGRTQAIFKIGLVISAAVWLPGLALVTACHPSAPAYWSILVLTSAAGCAIYYASLRRSLRNATTPIPPPGSPSPPSGW